MAASDTATVTVTITPANHAPVADDDTFTFNEDVTTDLDVLDGDSDADGDSLTITNITGVSKGTVSVVGGEIRYDPTQDANGTDTFTYKADDGHGGTSSSATVTVHITPVNDAPVARDDNTTVTEDIPKLVNVLTNDDDVDDTNLTITAKTNGSKGSVSIAGDGKSVTYSPAANKNGADSFTYTISDGDLTATATVNVDITPVEDVPTAGDDSYTFDEDITTDLDVLANDKDGDGEDLTITNITGVSKGTVSLVDGKIRYDPTQDANGTDTFTYKVDDGNGNTSSSATVTVTSRR